MRDSLCLGNTHCMVLNTIQDHMLSCMKALGVMVVVVEEEGSLTEMVLSFMKDGG